MDQHPQPEAGRPAESQRIYAAIPPALLAEFDQAYDQLAAPRVNGAADPFTAEEELVADLQARTRRGYVPLAGTPHGHTYVQAPSGVPRTHGRVPVGRRVSTWAQANRTRALVAALVAITCLTTLGVWATWQPATPAGPRAAGGSGAPSLAGAGDTVTPGTTPAPHAATSTTTDPFPAADAPGTLGALQNVVPQVRVDLLAPVSLELAHQGTTLAVYRVVASSPDRSGAWKPALAPGQVAWLAGSIVNQVFCLPAAALPAATPGDVLIVRSQAGSALHYTIGRVDMVPWQRSEILAQRRNGLTVVGCGPATPQEPRHVWLAQFRPADQPDAPVAAVAADPRATPTPGARQLDVTRLSAHVMADPGQNGAGALLLMARVTNLMDHPVTLAADALTVFDGDTGAVLPLRSGLPQTIQPHTDAQLALDLAAPHTSMAVLAASAPFGNRKWHITFKEKHP